jgi:hypothetical protein
MSCRLCGSSNDAELAAAMTIHFSGLKNLDNPGVLVFPKLLVCLDCGFARFTVPETALASVAKVTLANDSSTLEDGAGEVATQ